MRLGELVDDYLYEVSRRFTPATERKYGQILEKLIEHVGEKTPLEEIERTNLTSFLDKWRTAAPATKALHTTIVNNLFAHAVDIEKLEQVPGGKPLGRPPIPKPEDRDVVIVSLHDVAKLFQACKSWGDEICLGLLAYTGARRAAASKLRWRDLSLQADPPHAPFGWMKFREKGGKVIEKPIPGPLREIIDRAPEHTEDDYVVPNFRPNAVRRPERKNDIIYDRVKKIAERAGVKAHVHALRAAFAVFFLEVHRGTLKALQELLGHESLDTTRHYTRGLNRKVLMSEVVDMDWSALSETGEPRRDASPRSGLSPQPVSLSALTEEDGESNEGITTPVRAGAPVRGSSSSVSALSEGGSSHVRPDAAEAPLSESALSEGRGEAVGGGAGFPQVTPPSLSATVPEAGRLATGLGDRSGAPTDAPETRVRISPGALEELRSTDRRGEPDKTLEGPNRPTSEDASASPAPRSAMSRQSEPLEQVAAHNVLPPNAAEAHTGFEPVLLLNALLQVLQGERDADDDTEVPVTGTMDTVTAMNDDTNRRR